MLENNSLNQDELNFCASATHMQCWLWGLDIRHHDGNLLIKKGFCRHRSRVEKESSCYEMCLPCNSRLLLWGFGLALIDSKPFESDGFGIYLNRYRFHPIQITLHKDHELPFCPDNLNREENKSNHDKRRCFELLLKTASWISSYERWIDEELSFRYRQKCQELFGSDDEIWKKALSPHGTKLKICYQKL